MSGLINAASTSGLTLERLVRELCMLKWHRCPHCKGRGWVEP